MSKPSTLRNTVYAGNGTTTSHYAGVGVPKSQQLKFVKEAMPFAKEAGNQLGIPWQWVLSQWAFESGWGTEPGMKYDWGNIMTTGGRLAPQPNNNPQTFVTLYVNSFMNDFPGYNHAKKGQAITIQSLMNGKQQYGLNNQNQPITNYGSTVSGIFSNLKALGIPVPSHAKLGKQPTTVLGSLGHGLSSIPSTVAKALTPKLPWSRIIEIVIGSVLLILGFVILLGTEPKTVIEEPANETAKDEKKVVNMELTSQKTAINVKQGKRGKK